MRNFLFRGKTTAKPEIWVYGSLIYQDEYCLIRYWNGDNFRFEEYLVNPDTVSMFTGYVDCNEVKIFEGDVVATEFGRLCKVVWKQNPSMNGWDLVPLETDHAAPGELGLWYKENLEVVWNALNEYAKD